MTAGSRDLQRTFYIFLAQNIFEIQRCICSGTGLPQWLLRNRRLSVEHGSQFLNRPDRDHRRASRQCGFCRILRRNKQIPDPLCFRGNRHGKNAADGTDRSIQAHFSQKCGGRRRTTDCTGSCQYTNENWKVIMGACLLLIGRGKVHCDPAYRKGQSRRLCCRTDTLPGFLHRGIRKAHDIKARKAIGNITFRRHSTAADPGNSKCSDTADHGIISYAHNLTF